MDFSQLIANRHSTRSFSNRPVAVEQLKQIVSEASQTASWVNSQPWKVYVATGQTLETIKSRHLELIASGKKSSPIFPVRSRQDFHTDQQENMADWSAEKDSCQAVSDEEFWNLNRCLFNAPTILYFALPKESPTWSILDMGAFLQTASLSANNQGLGTMVAYEFIKFPEELATRLGVDASYEVVIGMAVGYEDDHPINQFRASRRGLDEIVTILE